MKVSTNYDGVSDPSSATWTDLTFEKSPGSWTWVNSGDVDLSNYTTQNVHIAFVYTGTSSSGKTWCVDDIMIRETDVKK